MREHKTYTIPSNVAEVIIRNCYNDFIVQFTKSNGEYRAMRVNSKKTGEYITENNIEVSDPQPNGVVVKTIDINLMSEGNSNPWRAIRLDRISEIFSPSTNTTFVVEHPVEEEAKDD